MKIDHKLAGFISEQKIAGLAVPVDNDGTIHIAMLHFAHDDSFAFYFVTGRDSQKCTLLKGRRTVKAACVVGTEKGVPFTLQMRGNIQAVEPSTEIKDILAAKRGGSTSDDLNDPANVVLQFKPNWARYTDYSIGYDSHHMLELKNAR